MRPAFRLVHLVLTFAFVGTSEPAPAPDFQGKIIFSVEEIERSMEPNEDGSNGPKQRTGIFYYYQEARPGQLDGERLTGYQLQNGEVVAIAGGGEGFLKKLRAIPISSFDVEREMSMTREKQRKKSGGGGLAVTDGAKYRIRYDFNGVSIDYTGWNPGPYIDFMAPDSENLANLKTLIDFFALNLGRRAMRLNPHD